MVVLALPLRLCLVAEVEGELLDDAVGVAALGGGFLDCGWWVGVRGGQRGWVAEGRWEGRAAARPARLASPRAHMHTHTQHAHTQDTHARALVLGNSLSWTKFQMKMVPLMMM